ncbi:MAG TPA: prepilin-type N-terminal cleavage/methylation domain-containing protein [Gemmatimonadaceae bacterium]|nr:prepilin-type N-terminal cleavage/methylation domain-containing protein [Gemmatimonadaceae bacterium]
MNLPIRRPPLRRAAPRPRSGMTLAEVIVAMVILTGVLLALGSFTVRFAQASGQARLVIAANELAARRLDAVRTQPTYLSVAALAGGRSVQSDFTTFAESTKVVRVGGAPTDSVDYMLVTVRVRHPSMRRVVSKTTAVAAF